MKEIDIIFKRWSDGLGSVIGVLIAASARIGFNGISAHLAFLDVVETCSTIPLKDVILLASSYGKIDRIYVYISCIGLWTFTWRRIVTDDDLAAALLSPCVPALHMSPFGRARRFSFWFLTLFFHTVNALLYALKMEEDFWCLLMKGSGSLVTLAVCIGLLMLLGQTFFITKDFWVSGGIFGILYVVIIAVGMISSQSSTVLGLMHILISLMMNILRFSCQEGFLQFDGVPFAVATLGVVGCCLPFIPDLHISAYKIASIIGLVFRLFYAIFLPGVARHKINRFFG